MLNQVSELPFSWSFNQVAPIESKPWLRRFDAGSTNQMPPSKASAEQQELKLSQHQGQQQHQIQQLQQQSIVAAVTTASTTIPTTTTTITTTTPASSNGMSRNKSPSSFPRGLSPGTPSANGKTGALEFRFKNDDDDDDDPFANDDDDDDLMDFMASVMDENNSNTLSPPPPAAPPPPPSSAPVPPSNAPAPSSASAPAASQLSTTASTTRGNAPSEESMNLFVASGASSHQCQDRTPPPPPIPEAIPIPEDGGEGGEEAKVRFLYLVKVLPWMM